MTHQVESTLAEQYLAIIDGKEVAAASGKTIPSYNPATGEQITEFAACDSEDVDKAIKNAQEAFDEWYGLQPEERGRRLRALSELITDNKERLAHLETFDTGKAISETTSDVEGSARYFEYFAGFADKIHGERIPISDEYVDYTLREPYGITAHIVPWNFPINLFARSVAPALTTGNVTVIKPAEQTSMTAVEVGKLALEAGIPPGVMNIVPGYGHEAGAALSGHPDVDEVSFTGSVPTGKEVAKSAVKNINPVQLELGGKSPSLVFPDADMDNAISNSMRSIFSVASGQMCLAASRLLVHKSIHDDFVDKLAGKAENLELGPGLDDPDVGPLVSEEQFEKVKQYIQLGREEVGEPVIGGETSKDGGYYVEPTIFDNVDNNTRIAQEEIFGPVLCVIPFKNEAEAFQIANDTDYGLVAGIYTSDVGRAHRFAREVQAGEVFINEWFAHGYGSPFGGFKSSGLGRQKGMEAIRGYTQVKNVCANIEI